MTTFALARILSEEAGQAILLILIMALVLLAAYYTSRFLARSMRGGRKGANLQLLDQLYLGKDKFVALLQLGDKGYLVGISGQTVTALDKLDPAELARLLEKQEHAADPDKKSARQARLADILKSFLTAPQRLQQARRVKAVQAEPDQDDLDELIKAVQQKNQAIRTGKNDGGNRE